MGHALPKEPDEWKMLLSPLEGALVVVVVAGVAFDGVLMGVNEHRLLLGIAGRDLSLALPSVQAIWTAFIGADHTIRAVRGRPSDSD